MEQWIPQGAAVSAVVAVVILFLRHIRESDARVEKIAKFCHAHQDHSQQTYERSLDRIVATGEKNTDRVVEQLKTVVDNQLEIVTELRNGNVKKVPSNE